MSKMGAIGRQLLGIVLGGACVLGASCANAQITPDRTLPNNSSVTINGSVFNITGGTQAGRNLFHSFQQFSIPTGSTASFNNGLDIQNIISRVTGGEASNIDGLIKASGTANLFFLNPNGIVFGQHASLNIGGSFLATTANAIQFGNLGFFSATNPEAVSPLLTINPSALLFNQIAAAPIQNNSVALAGKDPAGFDAFGLRVPDGKSLLLVGGNVSMDGGQLNAYGGRVEFGGLAASGNVGLNVDGDKLSLDFPASSSRADASLTNQAAVFVEAAGGGSIALNARNLEVTKGSLLSAGIGQGLGSVDSQAGDITLNATGEIKVIGEGSGVFNVVNQQAIGNGGNINVTAGSLSLTNGAQVDAATLGRGNGGNISVNVRDAVFFDGAGNGFASGIKSFVGARAIGQGGNLAISTGRLLVQNGAQISASTFGSGNSGDIIFNTVDTVELIGTSADGQFSSGIFSSVGVTARGKAGNLTINTGRLLVRDGAQISASTFGLGNSGNITFNTLNTVELIGTSADGQLASGIRAAVELGAIGKAGNLTINTGRLLVRDGAQISASTFGFGDSGNITFNTVDTVELIGTSADGRFASGIRAAVEPGAIGNGGNLIITTGGRLLVRDGAQISTATFGRGDAGDLFFRARDSVELIGASADGRLASGLTSAVEQGSIGRGGNLDLTTIRLVVRDGAAVTVRNQGIGNAGNLNVEAQSVSLDNKGELTANSVTGEGGNINLRIQDLLLMRRNSVISNTSGTALASGNEGNFTLSTQFLVAPAFENNDIITNAFNGRGGKIDITAFEGVFGFVVRTQQDLVWLLGTTDSTQLNPQKLPTNDISAISQTNPTIISPDIDPSRGLVTLPTVMEQAPKLVSSSCANFNETASGSQFTITGRSGLPPSPDEPLSSDVVWSDTRLPVTTEQHQHKTHAAKPKPQPIAIIPATGWVLNDKGEVTLISSVTNATTLNTPTSCPAK